MFGSLKKKLKQVFGKVSKEVEEEVEVEKAPVEEPKPVEEKIKEPEEEVKGEEPEEEVVEEEKIKEPEEEVKKEPEAKEEPKVEEEVKGEEPEEEVVEEGEIREPEVVEEVKEEVVEEEKIKEPEVVKEVKPEKIEGVKITYFVHGTTTDNENHLATGHASGELSELGIKQSKELPDQIKDDSFDVVFCSDLKRAVDSAELGFKGKYKIIQDKRVRECDYGDLTQKPCGDFKPKMLEYVENSFPNGESYKEVEIRIAEFLNYLYDNYYGKHIAIVAHQAPQLAMDVLLRGETWGQAINGDWRLKKAWQPGWEYWIKHKLKIPEKPKEKKKFLGIFGKKKKEEEKPKPEEVKEEKKEKKSIIEAFTKFNLSEEKFDKIFWDLEVVLLENNVAVEVIEKIKQDLKQDLTTGKISRKGVDEFIASSLRNSVEDVLNVEQYDLLKQIKEKKDKPFVIAMIGVNGSGKTTSMAKLANLLQKSGLSVVFAASDTFRAAAIQQLEEHADNLKIKLIKHDYGSDPAAVAFDAVKHAKAKNLDVVMIDTAGRMHNNEDLMRELEKLIRVNQPDLKIFVGEAITGNDCVEQAEYFNSKIGIDAIILAKADVDEKGGAFISVSYITKKPIIFIGTGQTYDDLKPFDKEIVIKGLEI